MVASVIRIRFCQQIFPYSTNTGPPMYSLGRFLITHYQIPLQIDQVFIKPGDVVLGDVDGVLGVPRDIACQVLLRFR